MLEGRAAIQGYLGRLEKWADRNLKKLNKGKVVNWNAITPCNSTGCGASWLKGPGGPGKQKAEHESALCPHSQEGQLHPGL